MEEIRAFSEEHIGDAASLYLKVVRGQNRPAPRSLQDAFRETLLDNPWASPEISSLVYLDSAKLVGFLGVIPRPMEFRGRPIRAATIALWMVDDEHRGLASIKLLRRLLKGPQDFSYVDGASNDASSALVSAGARISYVYSFNWVRILRPFGLARSLFDRMGGVWPMLNGASGLAAAPMDWLLSKAPVGMLRRPGSVCSSKLVSTAELLECIQEGRGPEPLRPAYSMPTFDWLISQAGKKKGRHQGLRTMIVLGPDGERRGWFVYYPNPERPAYVLQIGAHRRLQFGEVLSALFQDAWEQGSTAVKGQAIPQFLTTLTEQHCLFRQPYACVVGHSKDPEIMHAFQSADTALSRLDAGAWLPFWSEDWI